MAHMIEKFDKGAVFGTTWHNLAQYEQLISPVSIELARSIADYPMELRNNFISVEKTGEDGVVSTKNLDSGSRAVYRPDVGVVLVPAVGTDFHLENNFFLLDHIEDNFLKNFPDLIIESVGTLRNGATFFLNLKVKEFKVTGDKSPTVSNLMFQNPLGQGSYKCGAHNTRIVCNNTLTIAEAQAAANGSLFRLRHTRNAPTRIADALEQMAGFQLGLEKHIETMEHLARVRINESIVKDFLQSMYPSTVDSSSIKAANVRGNRDAVRSVLESDQDLVGGTAYALLNAYTNVVDHRSPSSMSDTAQVQWDSLYGKPAREKERALDTLLMLVA